LDSIFCKHIIQNNSEDSMRVEPPNPLWIRQCVGHATIGLFRLTFTVVYTLCSGYCYGFGRVNCQTKVTSFHFHDNLCIQNYIGLGSKHNGHF